MSVTELADKLGIYDGYLRVEEWHPKAIRLSTLEAIYRALECQPGDILEYEGNRKSAI